MRREAKRDIYNTYYEVRESKMGAPALPCGQNVVDSSKGDTGHGCWLDAAIDFFACAGDDVNTINRLYHVSVANTRNPQTREEKQISRKFWAKVSEKGLDDFATFIAERM